VEEQVAKVRGVINNDNAESIRHETEELFRVVQQIGTAAYQQDTPGGGETAGAAGDSGGSQGGGGDEGGGGSGSDGEEVVDGEFRNV
jgi:uncharacterized membrane protein YgcG